MLLSVKTDKRLRPFLWTAVPALLRTASALGLRPALPAEQIPAATDAPRPLKPEESRKRFRLPEGFRIELVAAELQLAEPTGMCFDARAHVRLRVARLQPRRSLRHPQVK